MLEQPPHLTVRLMESLLPPLVDEPEVRQVRWAWSNRGGGTREDVRFQLYFLIGPFQGFRSTKHLAEGENNKEDPEGRSPPPPLQSCTQTYSHNHAHTCTHPHTPLQAQGWEWRPDLRRSHLKGPHQEGPQSSLPPPEPF